MTDNPRDTPDGLECTHADGLPKPCRWPHCNCVIDGAKITASMTETPNPAEAARRIVAADFPEPTTSEVRARCNSFRPGVGGPCIYPTCGCNPSETPFEPMGVSAEQPPSALLSPAQAMDTMDNAHKHIAEAQAQAEAADRQAILERAAERVAKVWKFGSKNTISTVLAALLADDTKGG